MFLNAQCKFNLTKKIGKKSNKKSAQGPFVQVLLNFRTIKIELINESRETLSDFIHFTSFHIYSSKTKDQRKLKRKPLCFTFKIKLLQ